MKLKTKWVFIFDKYVNIYIIFMSEFTNDRYVDGSVIGPNEFKTAVLHIFSFKTPILHEIL